jgi:hypothetical protein
MPLVSQIKGSNPTQSPRLKGDLSHVAESCLSFLLSTIGLLQRDVENELKENAASKFNKTSDV